MKLFDHQHDVTSRHFHKMKYWFVLKITEIVIKKKLTGSLEKME